MAEARELTAPPLHAIPSSKEKKYDRQLRLWAASGQAALEQAHILLINSGSGVTGVETLKNSVSPGIGNFTILDSALVSEADSGVNFFLDEGCLGGFRAEHTCRFLQELNPDVKGTYITEPIESFIAKDKAFLPYTLIIVSAPINPACLALISDYAASNGIPVFYLHSVGYYSHFSVSLPPAFPIVDTHPDPASITDLRLLKPWPASTQFVQEKTLDLSSISSHDLGHIPYVSLLLHYLEQWKANHNGEAPISYKDKTAFREMVRSAGPPEEENYHEAVAAVLKSLNPHTPPSSVLAVSNAPEAQKLTPTSASFWYIARAIYTFYEQHGELPLPGAVPDMKAQSSDYIRLQNIYKSKAREDYQIVLAEVRRLEKQIGRSAEMAVDEKEVEQFCKGAAHAKLVRGKPLTVARPGVSVRWGSESAKNAVNALAMPDSGVSLYIAFSAWDLFTGSHDEDASGGAAKVPGEHDQELDSDEEKMSGIAQKMLDDVITEAGTFVEEPQYGEMKEESGKMVKELVRAGGSESHNIAALTGGMVAQEVIKAITKQYVPIDNTCVFDGITSKSAVVRV